MSENSWRLATLVVVWGLWCASLCAEERPSERVDYLREIKPIFKSRCYACHGALKQEAGLRLDAGRLIRQGSQSGNVLTAGTVDGPLVERITSRDLSQRMPPQGEPLTLTQVERIALWIQQGAESPDHEQPERDTRQHWAFQPPVRADVPQVDAGAQNPIDAFLEQERTRRGLMRQARTSKSVWLRRVFLDLIGLPPTPDQLTSFLGDDSPDACERVVDRLLNSAQYGERWGRHWMDVWRYSDWFGRRHVPDVWNSAPQIWRWRDWIVNSLNEDKGYGQMVAEMLAGDEVAPENDDAGYATGYLIRNWYALNPNDWMRSNVEHTGKAFLGLTFNCAHCHDHKYDPISQEDYFRFRAFFEPISIRQDRVPNEADPGPFDDYQYGVLRKIIRLGGVRIFDKFPEAPTWFYRGGDERNRVTERGSIAPGVPGFLTTQPVSIASVKLPPRAWYPGLRPAIQATILSDHQAALVAAESQLPSIREAVVTALPDLQTKLAEAEAEFVAARQLSEQAGRSSVLVGRQSLLLDATAGRRIVHHGLRAIKLRDDSLTIGFQLQILQDAHVNFQLAKDVEKGLTAGLIAFEKGSIVSYQPASFTEFEAGRYDIAAGQNRFDVELVLPAKDDRCLLSVRSLVDNVLLIDHVPVARNGWNPVDGLAKAITFDVRTGSVAAFDNVTVRALPDAAPDADSASSQLAYFDFESPTYCDGHDVIGIDGWFGSSFSQAQATSQVSAAVCDESLMQASKKVRDARRALEVQELRLKAAEMRRAACLAQLGSTNARIAADRARHGETPDADLPKVIRTASQLEREAAVLTTEADVVTKDQLLAVAETKPATDANRAKEIEAADKQLTLASVSLDKARAALQDPLQTDRYSALSQVYPETSTGRRRALAEWISNRDNPLTARVAVNHLWLRHFHSPLVATVYDFGLSGAPPTHPVLLDWLAVELMESGWNMKHLHRLIVTSETYAMSSSSGSDGNSSSAIDPENKFLWRMNPGRMEAEVVRDSLLSVADRLDPRMGGQELENSQALTTYRRTIYYCSQPEVDGKSALGTLFDAPEPADCYRRTQSIIPQQALALTNSELVHELSKTLADVLWKLQPAEQRSEPTAFITAAYERILTRRPTENELTICQEFLAVPAGANAGQVRLREGLVRALLNHNDFLAIR